MSSSPALDDAALYQKFGKYYDALYADRDYHKEIRLVMQMLTEFAGPGTQRILELGCGTGGHSIPLAENGYGVVGVDQSDVMLAAAKRKLAELPDLDLEFQWMDVRELAFQREFGACVSMFGCVSYLISIADLRRTLRGVQRSLREDGIFIFDFWNESAVASQRPSVRRKEVSLSAHDTLVRVATPEVNWPAKICSIRYEVSSFRDQMLQDTFEEVHKVRFFGEQEMVGELERAGFDVLGLRTAEGTTEGREESWFLVAIARRKGEQKNGAKRGAPKTARVRIPQFEPLLGDEELAQLRECVDTSWLTEGPKSEQFLARLRALTGAKHAVLAPNGTLALYMALAVCGIGPGDEVIVPDFTFLGSASSVALTGACPVFADVSPQTFNLDPGAVRCALSPKTRAIMPVHVYGQAADMAPLLQIAEQEDLYVIEDAAQGVGVRYQDRSVGTLGDLGCVSFFADKTITTGEGGAVFTDNDEFFERLQYFRNQGRLNRGSFLHQHMGWNFRLTDLQSGLGLAQLNRLDDIIARKRRLEQMYKERLTGLDAVQFPQMKEPDSCVPFRMNLLVPDPEALSNHLTEAGIGVRRFFYPLHRQPCFNERNSRAVGPLVHSVAAFEHGISLPSSAKLTEQDIDEVCGAIRSFFQPGTASGYRGSRASRNEATPSRVGSGA